MYHLLTDQVYNSLPDLTMKPFGRATLFAWRGSFKQIKQGFLPQNIGHYLLFALFFDKSYINKLGSSLSPLVPQISQSHEIVSKMRTGRMLQNIGKNVLYIDTITSRVVRRPCPTFWLHPWAVCCSL